ncbi:Uncharacterised protein [Mycobacteroides abscessus subsp. massiliense]|nr:Uncharacterised protein [Mycobacteroides abscessus subsp. massiliense]
MAVSPHQARAERGVFALLLLVEVDPPHRGHDGQGGHRDADHGAGVLCLLGAADDRIRRRQNGFTQHDQSEQPIALGDVHGMPGSRRHPLGEQGDRHVGKRDRDEQTEAHMLGCAHAPPHPGGLHGGDTRRVPQAGGAHGGVADGCS